MTNPSELRPVLDRINANLRAAIALQQIREAEDHDKYNTSRFDRTNAANALNLIRDSLLYEEVMCLMRIWDSNRQMKYQSIPTLIKKLTEPEVQAAIIERRRSAMLGLEASPQFSSYSEADKCILGRQSARDADRAAEETRAEIVECVTKAKAILGSDTLKACKKLRDKVVAHTLLVTHAETEAQEAGLNIPNFRYADERKLLMEMIPLVELLNVVIDDLHVSFASTQRNWRTYATAYWQGSTAPR